MNDALSASVLVLNRSYQPVHLTTARRAFCLLVRGAALAVGASGESYDFATWTRLPVQHDDDVIRTVSLVLPVPRVLRLARFDRMSLPVITLSHHNVMMRDGFQCQYCGARPGIAELNIDHVTPKSRGGRDIWENLVAACRTCNREKGGRTPEECGMHLLRSPIRPRRNLALRILIGSRTPYVEWEPFLQAS